MAVGFVKRFLVKILIEEDKNKKEELSNQLFKNILRNIVPIRENRHYERKKGSTKNKHPINKRKSI